MLRFTVSDAVAINARATPERTALEVVGGPSFTYRQLWSRVAALAEALQRARGRADSPMVGVLLGNEPDAVLTYLACQHAGLAAVPVNTRLAPPEVEYVLEDSGAAVLVAGGSFTATARALSSSLDLALVVADEVEAPLLAEIPRPVGAEDAGDQPVYVQYTSGTTGFPKGVVYTRDALLLHLSRYGWYMGLTSDHVVSVPGPVFHLSYGGITMSALTIGGRARLLPEFDPAVAYEELRDHCTWVFLVPTMLKTIVDVWQRRGREPLSALRFLVSSGAAVPAPLLEAAMEALPNATIAEAYGWSEAGWVTFERKVPGQVVPHSVGWPTPGSDVVVLDEEGRECPVGQPGQVAARNPMPFAGYLNRPDASRDAQRGGYVLSGDIGIVQDDGRLLVVDRMKDLIVSGGENVYSAEVERVLLEHPGIEEAAVVGTPDDHWGERVVAVVVPDGAELEVAEVQAFCRQRLAGYKVPRQVFVVDELPKNAMGKLLKYALRDQVRSQGRPG